MDVYNIPPYLTREFLQGTKYTCSLSRRTALGPGPHPSRSTTSRTPKSVGHQVSYIKWCHTISRCGTCGYTGPTALRREPEWNQTWPRSPSHQNRRGWDTGTQPTGGQAREVTCSRDMPREMLHSCGTGGLTSKMVLLRTELPVREPEPFRSSPLTPFLYIYVEPVNLTLSFLSSLNCIAKYNTTSSV